MGMLVIRREQDFTRCSLIHQLNSSLTAIALMSGADGELLDLVSNSILAIDGATTRGCASS